MYIRTAIIIISAESLIIQTLELTALLKHFHSKCMFYQSIVDQNLQTHWTIISDSVEAVVLGKNIRIKGDLFAV